MGIPPKVTQQGAEGRRNDVEPLSKERGLQPSSLRAAVLRLLPQNHRYWTAGPKSPTRNWAWSSQKKR